jgi:hypothetical protein
MRRFLLVVLLIWLTPAMSSATIVGTNPASTFSNSDDGSFDYSSTITANDDHKHADSYLGSQEFLTVDLTSVAGSLLIWTKSLERFYGGKAHFRPNFHRDGRFEVMVDLRSCQARDMCFSSPAGLWNLEVKGSTMKTRTGERRGPYKISISYWHYQLK